MTKEELNYIKDAFSQIIDDIAGNPDWNEAARAVASDLGTLERKLEKRVTSLPSNLDEAAEKYTNDSLNNLGAILRVNVSNAFKVGAEWMAGQGGTIECAIDWYDGPIPDCSEEQLFSAIEKAELEVGDKVIIQIRKK